jgi:hypothetical protein
MKYSKHCQLIVSILISLVILSIFIVWTALDILSLQELLMEDGPIELLSSIFFGLSSIFFILFAIRSKHLKEKNGWFRYFFTICWVLLMFIFMGEEISWGQRIFNITTPETLNEINAQKEINIHNIGFLDRYGGPYRLLSIMMLTTGLFLPIIAMSSIGKQTIQRFAFPVPPLGYSVLFVGAYLYGRFYYYTLLPVGASSEVREFLMSSAMLCFALHGAVCPRSLFRISVSKDESRI